MKKCCNIVFAGLGGQGVLKATDVLAEALFASGFDIKKSEVHGMSQRGGSVTSEVRFGEKVNSPMIPHGEADYLVVLDASQVDVNRSNLAPGGKLISVADYPADKLANPKTVNIMMLGALSAALSEIPEEPFIEALKKNLPEKHHEINLAAFAIGRAAAAK